MQGYLYFTTPVILIVSAYVIHALAHKLRTVPGGLRAVVIGLLFLSPFIRWYESFQFGAMAERPAFKYSTLPAGLDPATTVVFGSSSPYNDMFYLDVAASYDLVPEERVLDSLRQRYTVVVLE